MKLIQGDCLDEMSKFEDACIDLIITSPPYQDMRSAGYNRDKKDVLFLKLYSEFFDKIFKEYYRILKPDGQIFFNLKSKTLDKCLLTPHWFEFIDGFDNFYFKSFIIWKYAGSFDSTKKRFHLDYEIIYHLSKGDDIYLNEDCGINDPLTSVWYVPHNIPSKYRIHPTQMPEALVKRILQIASKKGDLVLDNFMGSGTTGVQCKRFGLDFIGIELNPNHYNKAKERIDNLTKQKTLF